MLCFERAATTMTLHRVVLAELSNVFVYNIASEVERKSMSIPYVEHRLTHTNAVCLAAFDSGGHSIGITFSYVLHDFSSTYKCVCAYWGDERPMLNHLWVVWQCKLSTEQQNPTKNTHTKHKHTAVWTNMK